MLIDLGFVPATPATADVTRGVVGVHTDCDGPGTVTVSHSDRGTEGDGVVISPGGCVAGSHKLVSGDWCEYPSSIGLISVPDLEFTVITGGMHAKMSLAYDHLCPG